MDSPSPLDKVRIQFAEGSALVEGNIEDVVAPPPPGDPDLVELVSKIAVATKPRP